MPVRPAVGGARYTPHNDIPERRQSSLLRRLVMWGGGSLVLLTLIIGALLFVFSPAELIRDRLVAEVRKTTGRTLAIEGSPYMSLWGGATVRLGRTTLSSPTGMKAPPLFVAEGVEITAALLPLLSGRVAIDRVALKRPVISLVVDDRGHRNWEFAAVSVGRVRLAQIIVAQGRTNNDGRSALDAFRAAANPASREVGGLTAETLQQLERLQLGEFLITGATVSFSDALSRRAERISGVDLTLKGRNIRSRVHVKLALDWRGERFSAAGELASPRDLLGVGTSPIAMKLDSAHGTFSGDGKLTIVGPPRFEGPVKFETSSLMRLAALAGVDLPNAAPFGGLTGQGRLVAEQSGVRLDDASLWVGGTAASGMIGVTTGGARPTIVMDLALASLDIDKLTAGLSEAGARPPGTTGGNNPKSIDDLLRDTTSGRELSDPAAAGRFSPDRGVSPPRAPQVRGYTRRLGWSEQPINATGLGLVEAKGRLALAGLTAGGVRVGATKLRLTLNSGVLTAEIDETTMYEGRGRGRVQVMPAEGDVAVSGAMTLDGVLLGQLLADAGGRPAVEGRARVNLAIQGRGPSEKALMSSLAGTADLRVVDGAVTGWDVGQIINGLGIGRLPSPTPDPAARTPFTQLSASFGITEGIATTSDIRLAGPHVTATGEGRIDVGERSLDFLVHPRVAANVVAPGSAINISKLQVPLRVRGPWERPEVAIAGGRLKLEGQEEIQKRVKEEFRGKSASDVVGDLLNNGSKSELADKARKLFREFFKR